MYSIKTDLGVLGNATVGKSLTVDGNAVFKQNVTVLGTVDFKSATFTAIEVSGTSSLADLTVSGTATVADLNVSGNTVLGDASTDTVSVKGSATFDAPVIHNGNITQSAGVATLKEVKADSIEVEGNITQTTTSTATLGNTSVQDLTVNGTTTVTGKTTLGDVEINGTLSGTYTMDSGNFNTIKVTDLSDLNNVAIKGSTTVTGNVTGNTSTISMNQFRVMGSNGILQFAYDDPLRPTDVKTSLEPYQVSSEKFVAGNVVSEAATIGDVNGIAGLKALGNANIDYLNITGNSTIGTSQPQLKVAGTSVLSGKTTVGDLEITGSVTGLTFADLSVDTLTVTGASSLAGVTMSGNLTGANTSIAKFSTFTVDNGVGENHGIIQFAYSDPARPTDTKSSVEPYKISTSELAIDNATAKSANIGDVNGLAGLHAIGKATIDYLNITGNSTIGTGTPQLKVAGNTELANTTVHDLTITGAVSGLSFTDLDVNTLNVSGASTLAGVTLSGNLTGSNTSIAKFSTVSIADGTAGNHGIIQFEYNDSSRPTDIKSSIEPYKVSANDIAAKAITSDSASIGVVGGTAGLHAVGKATADYLNITGNSTIGTSTPQLQVAGKSVLHDVDFTGVVTGLTVDVSGQDLTPASVVATGAVKGETLESVTTTTVGTDLTVGGNASVTGTLGVTGASTLAGNVTVTGQTTTLKDLVVTGTVTGVTAEANVDGLDIAPNSVAATTTVTAASITATGDVSGASVTAGTLKATGASTLAGVTAGATSASSLTVTGSSELASVTATTLTVPTITGNTTFSNDVTITGVLAPASIDLSTTAVDAASVTTTGNVNVGGNLVVTGTVDLSAAEVTGKTFKATDTSLPSTLPVLNSTTATITTINATDIDASGDVTAASVAATGDVSAATVTSPTVQAAALGAGTLNLASNVVAAKDLTVTGTFKPEGGFDLSQVDVAAKSISTTEGATIGGNLSVAGTVDLSGADVTALSFVSSDALKTNTFPKLASTEATTGTLTVTGASTLAGVQATNITASGTLAVTGASTLAGVTAGAVQASSVVSTTSVSAASFTTSGTTVEISKNTNVTGNLHATGTLTAGAIDLSTTDVTVKSLESLGNAHVVGDLTVDGQFDLSSTNLAALSLASSGNTTVGADLVLTTGVITGAPAISGNTTVGGTLGVTGATTLAGLTAGTSGLGNTTVTGTLNVSGVSTLAHTSANSLAVSGTATLGSLAVPTGDASIGGKLTVTGDTTVEKLTVQGQLVPTGGIDLSGADIAANSLSLAAGATVGTTLGVTGNTTVGGTLTSTGAGKFGSVTSDNGLTVTTGASTFGGSVTATGTGKFGSVTSDNGLTVTAGNMVVTAGNISQAGAATTTASFKKTTVSNLHVGTLAWDEAEYIAEVGGKVHISGDLDVDGTINAAINLTGRDIAPRSITTSQGVVVGTTLGVTGQSTMASAIIGAPESVSNNLQINGNTVSTGDFTVGGRIIGTLDQSTSDVVAKSVTASTFVKGATLESTAGATIGTTLSIGGATTAGGKITVSAGGIDVTGGSKTDTLTTTGAVIIGSTTAAAGKVTISAGGLSVVGGSTTDTLAVTGTLTSTGLASLNGGVTTTNLTATTASTLAAASATTLDVSGLSTLADVTITGTLTTDIADLVTDSVTTKRYAVTPTTVSGTVTGTWTPDGTSSVYNISTSGAVQIAPLPNPGSKAGSWFFYVTNTDGGAISMDSTYGTVGGEWSTTPGSVTICQVVYCGVGSVYDVFLAQRP